MECKEVRSKLKEYVTLEIKDEYILKQMEEHIENCVICKRELLLWQDVLAKQMETSRLASYLTGGFRSRVKYRLNRIEGDSSLPPAVKRIQAMQRLLTSPTGRLVVQILILLMGVLFLLFVLKKGTNIISLGFILLGFSMLLFLVIKNRKKN